MTKFCPNFEFIKSLSVKTQKEIETLVLAARDRRERVRIEFDGMYEESFEFNTMSETEWECYQDSGGSWYYSPPAHFLDPIHLEIVLETIYDQGDQTFPSGTFHQGWWVNKFRNDGTCVVSCGQSVPPLPHQIEITKEFLRNCGEKL